MLKVWILRIKNHFCIRQRTTAQRQVERWMVDSQQLLEQLNQAILKLGDFSRRLSTITDDYQKRISEADQLVRQHDTVLESLRSENTVLGIEVTALTAANQLVLERYRADTAIQTARQVALRTKED